MVGVEVLDGLGAIFFGVVGGDTADGVRCVGLDVANDRFGVFVSTQAREGKKNCLRVPSHKKVTVLSMDIYFIGP